jgi:hypothetical protein
MRTQEFIDSLLENACPMDSVKGIIHKFAITTHCVDWEVVAYRDYDGHWVVSDFHTIEEVK